MNREKTIISLFVAACLACISMHGQNISISGKVVDQNNEPLPGAAVTIKTTTSGVITDIDGNYTISAPATAVLEASFIGYETISTKVDGRSTINFILSEQSNLLNETVVIGYGVQRKVDLTGSVASVNYEDINKSRPISSTAQGLIGASAGVQVTQTSGQPGQESISIKVRGVGTLNDSSPLVVIDGFEGSLANVAPDDIASISILKDAASCAIYGNRGANGVILVTTKDGSKEGGKVSVTYSGIASYNKPLNYFHVISDYADYMAVMNESYENVDLTPIFSQSTIDLWREKSKHPNEISESGYPNYVAYPNVDWMKALFQDGIYQKHNISIRGSEGKTKFLVSGSFMDNPGIIMNTRYSDVNYRINLTTQVTKWLELGARLYGGNGNRQLSGISSASDYMSRAVPCIYPKYEGKYGYIENKEHVCDARNNLYFIDRVGGYAKTADITSALFANIKLPLGLVNSFSFSNRNSNYWYHKNYNFMNCYSFQRGQYEYFYNDLASGYVQHQGNIVNLWTVQDNISWNRTIAKKHSVSAMLGFEATAYRKENVSAQKNKMSDYDLVQLDNAITPNKISGTTTEYAAASFFGRVNYSYAGKYLLEANMRYDGSSRFSAQTRWGLFPSVSAGWRISEEPWMKGLGIDNLKLRASWGRLGNNAIGNYEYIATYSDGYLYSLGNKQVSGIVASINNDTLTWETTTTSDVGIDYAMLGGRLTAEIDAYNKITDGILYKAPIYATIGDKSEPYQNLCEVTNRGVEFTLGWKDDIGAFHYSVSGNFTYNKNEVTKYKGKLQTGWARDEFGGKVWETNIGEVSTANGVKRVLEGKIINEYYLLNIYKGDGSHFYSDGTVNPEGGPKDGMIRSEEDMAWAQAMVASGATFMPNKKIGKNSIWYGDYLYADENGDGIYGGQDDYSFQGKSLTPKFYYGLQLGAGWKGLDVSVSLAGAGGNAIYWRYLGFNCYSTRLNTTLPYEIAYDHYFYDPENPSDPRTNTKSKHGRLTANYDAEQNGGSVSSTLWLYKGDYLKLKNLTIGYTFPESLTKRISMKDLRVYFSGENLFTLTQYPGMDPEFSDTKNYYSQLRQLSLGLTVKF